MNLTIASINEEANAVPEKNISEAMTTKTIAQTYNDIIQEICKLRSYYETTLSQIRFVDETDDANGADKAKAIGDINDSKYDLGVDGSFGHYSILFIILYLCRGEADENGKVIDELKNGGVSASVGKRKGRIHLVRTDVCGWRSAER